MKPLLSIATLMLFFTTLCHSQNIDIADFLQLRGKTKNVVESRLNSMNILLYDEDAIGNGKTHYTYQKNSNSEGITSSFQWIDFIYEQDAQWNNRLSFQIQDIELVKKYLTEMKEIGFEFSNKKIVDRQIYEVYTDGINTVELITSQTRSALNNDMFFNFVFYNTDEYQYAFSNENKIYTVPQINQNELFADLVGFPITAAK